MCPVRPGGPELTTERPLTRATVMAMAVGFEGGMLLLALIAGLLLDRSPLGLLQATGTAVALGLAAAAPLLLLLAWSLSSDLPAMVRLRRDVQDGLVPVFASCRPPDIAVISILAGLGEEALFRGLIQTGLADALGPWIGLIAASTLFGLAHLITSTYALLAGLVGAYLGLLFMASGNLMLPVVTHSVYDFVALTFLMRHTSQHRLTERPFESLEPDHEDGTPTGGSGT